MVAAAIFLSMRLASQARACSGKKAYYYGEPSSSLLQHQKDHVDLRLRAGGLDPYFDPPGGAAWQQRRQGAGMIHGVAIVEMPPKHYEGLVTLLSPNHRIWHELYGQSEHVTFWQIAATLDLREPVLPISQRDQVVDVKQRSRACVELS